MLSVIDKVEKFRELNTLCQLLAECSHALHVANKNLGYFNP